MRSKDFVSVFFYYNNFWSQCPEVERNKNEQKKWKEVIAVAVGAVIVKAVRDVIKTKKQEEALKTALDDFYEEELN